MTQSLLEKTYSQHAQQSVSDMALHMPTLKKFASECKSVTEFGVRYGSSSIALLSALPLSYVGYDLMPPPAFLKPVCDENNILYRFFQKKIEPGICFGLTDLLLVDSTHTYEQVSFELTFAPCVTKYIILHDTHYFECVKNAMQDFLAQHSEWEICYDIELSFGLTILQRQNSFPLPMVGVPQPV